MHCICITKREFQDGFHFPAFLRVPAMSKRAVGFHLKSRCGVAMQTSRMSDAQCGHKSDQVATLNCRLGDKETSSRSALSTAALHTDCYDALIGQFALYWSRLARRRKTRGTSTQVPCIPATSVPSERIFFESWRDRKPTTSGPETLDSGHDCIPVEEPKSARRELKQLLNYACLLFAFTLIYELHK